VILKFLSDFPLQSWRRDGGYPDEETVGGQDADDVIREFRSESILGRPVKQSCSIYLVWYELRKGLRSDHIHFDWLLRHISLLFESWGFHDVRNFRNPELE
jgi:hypothetical protein